MTNWIKYLQQVIENYFSNTGKLFENNKLFQKNFDDQLWGNIRNFIKNLIQLPLWKNKSMASTIFSGKNNYDYWQTIFQTGDNSSGAKVLAQALNYIEMIQDRQ